MSKKNRHSFQEPQARATANISASHAAEYRGIRNDLIRVVVLNVIILAAVLAIYFTDQKSHYLEQIYSRLF